MTFAPASFAVAEDANRYPFHGKTVPGVGFTVTDRFAFDAPELGIELIGALHHLYPQFQMEKTARLIANVDTMQALANRTDPREIAKAWATDLDSFRHRRDRYLLYR